MKTVAILGRPNVGKSTLFNLLSEGDKALVHPTAGTTRDVRRVPAELFGLHFDLLDTAGIEEGKGTTGLQDSLNTRAKSAATQADVLLLIFDGTTGLLPADRALAQFARKLGKPVVVAVNKADVKTAAATLDDFATLGLAEPVLISAAHNQGLDDLHAALSAYIPTIPGYHGEAADAGFLTEEVGEKVEETEEDPVSTFTMPEVLRVAILGRPNVGKSTLVNALLGEEKMLTGDLAGLTREAIGHEFTHTAKDGTTQRIRLVDTPGLRKKANVVDELETMSVGQSLTAANKAHISILVVDVSDYSIETGNWQVFEQQDARIAGAILNAGKPLIVALNKWDAVAEKEDCLADTSFQLRRRLHQLAQPMTVPISAERKKGLKELLESAFTVYAAYHSRSGTSRLNRLLAKTLAKRSPPLSNGKPVNLKYVTQTLTRPPTLAIWGTRVDDLPDSYKLFLRNQFAEALGLQNVPLRFTFRSSRNPYLRNKKR